MQAGQWVGAEHCPSLQVSTQPGLPPTHPALRLSHRPVATLLSTSSPLQNQKSCPQRSIRTVHQSTPIIEPLAAASLPPAGVAAVVVVGRSPYEAAELRLLGLVVVDEAYQATTVRLVQRHRGLPCLPAEPCPWGQHWEVAWGLVHAVVGLQPPAYHGSSSSRTTLCTVGPCTAKTALGPGPPLGLLVGKPLDFLVDGSIVQVLEEVVVGVERAHGESMPGRKLGDAARHGPGLRHRLRLVKVMAACEVVPVSPAADPYVRWQEACEQDCGDCCRNSRSSKICVWAASGCLLACLMTSLSRISQPARQMGCRPLTSRTQSCQASFKAITDLPFT